MAMGLCIICGVTENTERFGVMGRVLNMLDARECWTNSGIRTTPHISYVEYLHHPINRTLIFFGGRGTGWVCDEDPTSQWGDGEWGSVEGNGFTGAE
jgi:hypothetical protein